ncbi:MAG: 3'-5' exonuclease [Bacteroidota bacterium]|nr:3'-5' exonuclease [Bacteroidota bacterium]
MELNLRRPLAFFDLETTGVNVARDRIIEISVVKIHPDGREEWYTKRLNPGMPISPQASAIHGITDEDVKDCPSFREIGKNLAKFLEGCDLAGYNAIRFDIPLLAEEFLREEIEFDIRKRKYIDVQVIFHKKEQRTLSAAYMFYCKKKLSNAHSARADTEATVEILKAQLDRYDDLENDVDKLSSFSHHSRFADLAGRIIYNSKGQEIFNFGKHKGELVEEVLKKEPSYFTWMMEGDFPEYTKKVLTGIKLRAFSSG